MYTKFFKKNRNKKQDKQVNKNKTKTNEKALLPFQNFELNLFKKCFKTNYLTPKKFFFAIMFYPVLCI